jgi:hypothetical protein
MFGFSVKQILLITGIAVVAAKYIVPAINKATAKTV